jgi:hypothetical protein
MGGRYVIKKLNHLKGKDVTVHCFNEWGGEGK